MNSIHSEVLGLGEALGGFLMDYFKGDDEVVPHFSGMRLFQKNFIV